MINLRSKISKKVLRYFFLNKNKSHYISELAKILSVDKSNLYNTLLKLEREGLLISEFKGKERYFSINKDYPLLDSYENIVKRTFGIPFVLKDKFKSLCTIRHLYIYGSFANDKFSNSSDIDVIIIGSAKRLEVAKIFSELEKELQREFNLVIFSEKEFKKKKDKDPFLLDVFSKEIIKVI